jgi:uncharacterized membrane protein
VLLPLATFLSRDAEGARFALLLSASVVYIVGSFGVTVAGNVPLNEKIARADASAGAAAARAAFERPWNRLHTVRTVASIAATVLVFVACLA